MTTNNFLMEIPDPLAYFMIAVTIISGIITISTFFKSSWPQIKIIPWRKIGLTASTFWYILGGVYIIGFGFFAGYLISEIMTPESKIGQTYPDIYPVYKAVTVNLLILFFTLVGGLGILIGTLKFLKVTGICPEKVERIAIKLYIHKILKKNTI